MDNLLDALKTGSAFNTARRKRNPKPHGGKKWGKYDVSWCKSFGCTCMCGQGWWSLLPPPTPLHCSHSSPSSPFPPLYSVCLYRNHKLEKLWEDCSEWNILRGYASLTLTCFIIILQHSLFCCNIHVFNLGMVIYIGEGELKVMRRKPVDIMAMQEDCW